MKLSWVSIVALTALIVGGGIWLATGPNDTSPAADATAVSGDRSPSPPTSGPDGRSGLPRLVDLGSRQCIPCKMMAPILDDLRRGHADQFITEFIDVNENPQAAGNFGIRLIPTQVFLDAAGRELYRHEGFLSREAILGKWKELGVAVR